ncbi:MAG: hypothetical protein C4341_06315 [Armatimonadota bacterium]
MVGELPNQIASIMVVVAVAGLQFVGAQAYGVVSGPNVMAAWREIGSQRVAGGKLLTLPAVRLS